MNATKEGVILLGIFCIIANMAFAQTNCENPVISVEDSRGESLMLRQQRSDTVLIRVSCLRDCKVIATSKTMGIRRLADGRFIFRPHKTGEHEVVVRTECPNGTKLPSGLDMSGTTPIGTVKFEAQE